MKKKNNNSKTPKHLAGLTTKQVAGVNRQALALGKFIVRAEGDVLVKWLELGRLVLISGVRQADIIKSLAKAGVKMDKGDLNKAVTCAKWKTNRKFTSLAAMYASAPRKQVHATRKFVVTADIKRKRVTIGDVVKAHKQAHGNLRKIVELLA